MFCVKCGNQLDPKSQFCPFCGERTKKIENISGESSNFSDKNIQDNSNQSTKNNKSLIVGLVIFISFFIIVIIVGVYLYMSNKGKNVDSLDKNIEVETSNGGIMDSTTNNTTTNDGNITSSNITNNNGNSNKKDGNKIGNNEFGYLTVSGNWSRLYNADLDEVLQYSSEGKEMAVSMCYSTEINAKTYANNALDKMSQDGATNINSDTVNLGKYNAYQIYGYYPKENLWLFAWFFETEDGKTRYIGIEGPNKYSESFNIVKTFSLT